MSDLELSTNQELTEEIIKRCQETGRSFLCVYEQEDKLIRSIVGGQKDVLSMCLAAGLVKGLGHNVAFDILTEACTLIWQNYVEGQKNDA